MKNKKQAGPIAGFFITLLLAVTGFFVIFYIGWPQYQMAKESPNWPSVDGTITESKVVSVVKKEKNKSKTMYSASIIYKYKVDGISLTAHDTYLGSSSSSSSNRSNAQAIVNKYPTSSNVKVYYSPDRPSTGILEPGVKFTHYMILLIGGALLLVGGLGLVITTLKILVFTSVVAVAASSAITKQSHQKKNSLNKRPKTKSIKQIKNEQEGELINLDDEMDDVNKLSQSSISPAEQPWKYQWMIVTSKKEYGPYSYDKILNFLDKGKVKSTHICYSPSGGDKISIGQLSNIKKAS